MDTLRELFRYHTWATLALIDHCATLPPQELHATAPGTWGPILGTFVHLVAAEGRYLNRFPDGTPGTPLREGMEPPLADVRSQFERQSQRWQHLLDRQAELDITMPADRDWPATPHAQVLLFLQTIHHGNDHRTQIGTILGARELPAPEIDGWAYWATVHHRLP